MGITQRTKSLASRESPLRQSFYQLQVLNAPGKPLTGHSKDTDQAQLPSFADSLAAYGYTSLKPVSIDVMQVNVGKLCNQSCAHCHVDAGPDRKEIMTRDVMQQCLDVIKKHGIPTVDITGGAPELNPHFRWFVKSCASIGVKIIHRCNLTILVSGLKYADLPDFLARHSVNIIASLPFFSRQRTDSQRGVGVFDDSIKALRLLNDVGYGKHECNLKLDLVYNPSGAYLPSDQRALEEEFRVQLMRRYGIQFSSLLTIANLPISRFLEYLITSDNYESYMSELVNAFNPRTIDGLMCRSMISVGWDGRLYDCDFNQMLELSVESKAGHISNFNKELLEQRCISTNQHCYGCTAGAGSSCGGSIM